MSAPRGGTIVVGGGGGGRPGAEPQRSPGGEPGLADLQAATAQQRADALFGKRKFWYKPVALLGGGIYSIAEGEAVSFVIGKRMLVTHEPNPTARKKGGFLVYECASRALQAALYRPRGRLASATKAVLRVRASRPCAPPSSRWPTAGGVWAFEV